MPRVQQPSDDTVKAAPEGASKAPEKPAKKFLDQAAAKDALTKAFGALKTIDPGKVSVLKQADFQAAMTRSRSLGCARTGRVPAARSGRIDTDVRAIQDSDAQRRLMRDLNEVRMEALYAVERKAMSLRLNRYVQAQQK